MEVVEIGRDTEFGNPIIKNKTCQICGQVHRIPGSTLNCYRKWLWNKIKTDKEFVEKLEKLDGKKLHCPGCGVDSETCHGSVLKRAINWLKGDRKPNNNKLSD